jgi:hypothetical protein
MTRRTWFAILAALFTKRQTAWRAVSDPVRRVVHFRSRQYALGFTVTRAQLENDAYAHLMRHIAEHARCIRAEQDRALLEAFDGPLCRRLTAPAPTDARSPGRIS